MCIHMYMSLYIYIYRYICIIIIIIIIIFIISSSPWLQHMHRQCKSDVQPCAPTGA